MPKLTKKQSQKNNNKGKGKGKAKVGKQPQGFMKFQGNPGQQMSKKQMKKMQQQMNPNKGMPNPNQMQKQMGFPNPNQMPNPMGMPNYPGQGKLPPNMPKHFMDPNKSIYNHYQQAEAKTAKKGMTKNMTNGSTMIKYLKKIHKYTKKTHNIIKKDSKYGQLNRTTLESCYTKIKTLYSRIKKENKDKKKNK